MTAPLVETPARGDLPAHAAALATVVLWASGFPLTAIALRSFDPAGLAAFRIALAGGAMALWLAWRRPVMPDVGDLLRLGLNGAIGIAAFSLLIHAGQLTVSASATSFIVNTVPLITALLAALFLGERLPAAAWLCTGVSFAGVALIASGQPGGLNFGAGSLAILGAALCQAVFFIRQRPLLARHGPAICVPLVVTAGAISLTPWLPAALPQLAAAGPVELLAAVALGLFPAALGHATWGIAQARLGPSKAANFLYLVPVVATGLAYLMTGEEPGWLTLAGGALAIGGVVLFNWVQRPPGRS